MDGNIRPRKGFGEVGTINLGRTQQHSHSVEWHSVAGERDNPTRDLYTLAPLTGRGKYFTAVPIPVIPSDIVILLGIALFAQGSRRSAIILDAIERWLREHVPAAFRLWRRLSRTGKIAVTVGWMALVSGVSYGLYVLLSD